MAAFLIITSLSLAFYLGLLIVLYRDGRNRRIKASPVRRVSLGTVAELSTGGAISITNLPGRREVFVYSAEKSRRRTRQPRVTTGEPAEVITLPRLAHSKNDLQCG